jgi:hypothetical protein
MSTHLPVPAERLTPSASAVAEAEANIWHATWAANDNRIRALRHEAGLALATTRYAEAGSQQQQLKNGFMLEPVSDAAKRYVDPLRIEATELSYRNIIVAFLAEKDPKGTLLLPILKPGKEQYDYAIKVAQAAGPERMLAVLRLVEEAREVARAAGDIHITPHGRASPEVKKRLEEFAVMSILESEILFLHGFQQLDPWLARAVHTLSIKQQPAEPIVGEPVD